MKLVLATKNQHKVEEFSRMLSPLGIEIISQTQAGIEIDVDENADSFEGNARLKAEAIYQQCKMATIADDSGLEIDALNNAPGVYSARYGGESCRSDKDRYKLVLSQMQNVPKDKRGAQFVCSICYIDNSGKCQSFTGYCRGEIGYEPRGENGFGYDPIFMVGEKSFSQLSAEEKDKISHRGNAMKLLYDSLKASFNK